MTARQTTFSSIVHCLFPRPSPGWELSGRDVPPTRRWLVASEIQRVIVPCQSVPVCCFFLQCMTLFRSSDDASGSLWGEGELWIGILQ